MSHHESGRTTTASKPSMGLHSRRQVMARLASLGLAVPAMSMAGTAFGAAATRLQSPSPEPSGLIHRDMTYDTGTNVFPGILSRETWEPEYVEREITAIADDLHCTAIGIFGTDIDRIAAGADIAVAHGLDVWLQPRLVNGDVEATQAHLAELAQVAGGLRAQGGGVTLNVGCELTLFVDGIIPGASFEERLLTMLETLDQLPAYNDALNALLAELVDLASADFDGPLTYASGPWEAVDWTGFDYVGVDYYIDANNRATYASDLRQYHEWGKPVIITEFGSTTYEGAEDAGGLGYNIVDWEQTPPALNGDFVRSEQTQADTIAELLSIYEAEGVAGAFVYTFIEPLLPYSPDPRYDLDMASYGVVKVFPDDSEQAYAATGSWEPKLAFDTIADFYGGS